MKRIETTARKMALALPIMLTVDAAQAGVEVGAPGPGVFGLIALGVIGALAISRSRK